jgi:hypothetical protein
VFRPCKEEDGDEILLEVWKINIERERERGLVEREETKEKE